MESVLRKKLLGRFGCVLVVEVFCCVPKGIDEPVGIVTPDLANELYGGLDVDRRVFVEGPLLADVIKQNDDADEDAQRESDRLGLEAARSDQQGERTKRKQQPPLWNRTDPRPS